ATSFSTVDFGIDYAPLPGLNYNLSYSLVSDNADRSTNTPKYTFYSTALGKEDVVWMQNLRNGLQEHGSKGMRTTFRQTLTYDKNWHEHHNFHALVGYAEEEYKFKSTGISAMDFYNNDIWA